MITEINFTKHYFDADPDNTKDLIIWLVNQWRQKIELKNEQPENPELPHVSSSFRRLFRLICTTRGMKSLNLLKERDKRDKVLGVADDEKAKDFVNKFLEKLSSEDGEQFPFKSSKLKKYFEKSLCEYIRFQDPEKSFRDTIKETGSIFHLIENPKCPIYIRIDLLTELSFRKLRIATEDTLFGTDSRIQTELEEMVEYGDKLSKRIESDYHVDHLEDQLLGSPSLSIALFNLRKTLIKIRYCSSPQDVFESAMETIKLYKYTRDELRAIYGQIWSYHAIMRAHMFRGDEIHVEIYKGIIESMVSCLEDPNKNVSKEEVNSNKDKNKGKKNTETKEMNDKYITFGKYFKSWNLADQTLRGRSHKLPDGLIKIQKEFFKIDEKKRTVKWDSELHWKKVVDDKNLDLIYPYGKTQTPKTGGIVLPSIFDSIKPLTTKSSKSAGIDEIESKTPYGQGRHGKIFVKRRELRAEMKKKLILAIPDKLGECINIILTSKSPLKISYLRLMTREYLLQFSKIACTKVSKTTTNPTKKEPYYMANKTVLKQDWTQSVESFINEPCDELKKVLKSLHQEFDLIQEYIAMKEIESYIKAINSFQKSGIRKEKGSCFGNIQSIGHEIQGALRKYICEETPNSKLYFPRKYPRTTN